jgi:hypothetical protein
VFFPRIPVVFPATVSNSRLSPNPYFFLQPVIRTKANRSSYVKIAKANTGYCRKDTAHRREFMNCKRGFRGIERKRIAVTTGIRVCDLVEFLDFNQLLF